MTTAPPPTGPPSHEWRSAAEAIYADRYQQECERSRVGEFVVINVTDGSAEIARFPEEALQRALKARTGRGVLSDPNRLIERVPDELR